MTTLCGKCGKAVCECVHTSLCRPVDEIDPAMVFLHAVMAMTLRDLAVNVGLATQEIVDKHNAETAEAAGITVTAIGNATERKQV